MIKNDTVTRTELLNILFMPGFSSKTETTEISGRGVGLDVVKADIDKLNGKIMIATEKNKGTKFILKLPT